MEFGAEIFWIDNDTALTNKNKTKHTHPNMRAKITVSTFIPLTIPSLLDNKLMFLTVKQSENFAGSQHRSRFLMIGYPSPFHLRPKYST